SDRRGRTASVREVGGFRRPARNWLSHSAPSPSYSSSAAACRVQFGLYRWVLPTAMRSARLANRIEFASSNDEIAPTAMTATPAGPATSCLMRSAYGVWYERP